MGSAFYGVDIVYVRVDLLPVAVVVLEGYVNRDDLVGVDANRIRDEGLGISIEIIDELAQAFVGIEYLGTVNLPAACLGLPCCRILNHLVHQFPLVGEHYPDALVEEGQLAQTRRKRIVFIYRSLGEDFRIRMEGDGGTGIFALPRHFDRSKRFALGIVLHEDFSLPVDFGSKAVRKRIHAGHAHTVQTAGNLVVGFAELAAGV